MFNPISLLVTFILKYVDRISTQFRSIGASALTIDLRGDRLPNETDFGNLLLDIYQLRGGRCAPSELVVIRHRYKSAYRSSDPKSALYCVENLEDLQQFLRKELWISLDIKGLEAYKTKARLRYEAR